MNEFSPQFFKNTNNDTETEKVKSIKTQEDISIVHNAKNQGSEKTADQMLNISSSIVKKCKIIG